MEQHALAQRLRMARAYRGWSQTKLAKLSGVHNMQISKLERGVTIDGHRTAPAVIRLVKETASNAWYEVVLYEGRNQQIRKMFDSVGHSVVKLRRVAIGPLQNEKLPVGSYRLLTETEVRRFLSKSR